MFFEAIHMCCFYQACHLHTFILGQKICGMCENNRCHYLMLKGPISWYIFQWNLYMTIFSGQSVLMYSCFPIFVILTIWSTPTLFSARGIPILFKSWKCFIFAIEHRLQDLTVKNNQLNIQEDWVQNFHGKSETRKGTMRRAGFEFLKTRTEQEGSNCFNFLASCRFCSSPLRTKFWLCIKISRNLTNWKLRSRDPTLFSQTVSFKLSTPKFLDDGYCQVPNTKLRSRNIQPPELIISSTQT